MIPRLLPLGQWAALTILHSYSARVIALLRERGQATLEWLRLGGQLNCQAMLPGAARFLVRS